MSRATTRSGTHCRRLDDGLILLVSKATTSAESAFLHGGAYQQDDRDIRAGTCRMEKCWSRGHARDAAALPPAGCGIITTKQWQAIDSVCR